mgnify:CR=1 FL=1
MMFFAAWFWAFFGAALFPAAGDPVLLADGTQMLNPAGDPAVKPLPDTGSQTMLKLTAFRRTGGQLLAAGLQPQGPLARVARARARRLAARTPMDSIRPRFS